MDLKTSKDKQQNLALPLYVETALSILETAGYRAYVVGGWVRDALLKRMGSDVDLCSNASWEKARDLFKAQGWKVYETGAIHGTITVRCAQHSIELTTFRKESAYADHRHPSSVEFVSSIEEDLARRDFTMNAIAYSHQSGFVDPFGGIDDIENTLIRAVGNPAERFREDALRIIRAVRFSSQLGFEIEEQTQTALMSQSQLLGFVSKERIYPELVKLFNSNNAREIIEHYWNVVLIALGFEKIALCNEFRCVFLECIRCVDDLTIQDNAIARDEWVFACFGLALVITHDTEQSFSDLNPSFEQFTKTLVSFAMPSDKRKKILVITKMLIQVLQNEVPITTRQLGIFASTIQSVLSSKIKTQECMFELGEFLNLCGETETQKLKAIMYNNFSNVWDQFNAMQYPWSIRELAISGDDIIQVLNISPSKQVRIIQQALFDAVLENIIENKKAALCEWIQANREYLL